MPYVKAEMLGWRQALADVSTPGHGQGAGPASYEFRVAGRSRLWEGPECSRAGRGERSSARACSLPVRSLGEFSLLSGEMAQNPDGDSM